MTDRPFGFTGTCHRAITCHPRALPSRTASNYRVFLRAVCLSRGQVRQERKIREHVTRRAFINQLSNIHYDSAMRDIERVARGARARARAALYVNGRNVRFTRLRPLR